MQFATFTLLLVQTLVGLVPQVSLRCLTCPAAECSCTASPACCEECRKESAPATPCPCVTERQPVATVVKSETPSTTLLCVWHTPAIPLAANGRQFIVSTLAQDLPTIPARILFCTWLK